MLKTRMVMEFQTQNKVYNQVMPNKVSSPILPVDGSIYDLKLEGSNGEQNILSDLQGKVTLFINVTGHCGNAPQFGIIESLYKKYKPLGFEVVAIPTNDFCGPKVTYGEYEKGCRNGKMSEDYARSEWGATYRFSELVHSGYSMNEIAEGSVAHPIFEKLNALNEPLQGNFEKFLVGKDGRSVLRWANGALLDFAYESGDYVLQPQEGLSQISEAIEELLSE